MSRSRAYDTMPNFTLNQAMYDSAIKIPEITYTEDEINFAKEVYRNATGKEADHDLLPTTIAPHTGTITSGGGSTDVGDVSYIIPTVQFFGHWPLDRLPLSPLEHNRLHRHVHRPQSTNLQRQSPGSERLRPVAPPRNHRKSLGRAPQEPGGRAPYIAGWMTSINFVSLSFVFL